MRRVWGQGRRWLAQAKATQVFVRFKSSALAQNTLWMFLGQWMRLIIQAFYFVMIARALGAEGYGAFVGVAALVSILAPFATLGTGNLLIKNVSRNENLFGKYWGNALVTTLVSGLILISLVLLSARYILPGSISSLLVLSVSVSELFFARMLEVSGQAFQAFQRLAWTAQLHVLLSAARALAAFGLSVFFMSPTPVQWGLLYLSSTAFSASIAVWIAHRKLGGASLDLARAVREFREGVYFSVSLSSQAIHGDIDKLMLAQLSTLNAAGIYAAAYRLIDVSFTPVRSLVGASYTRFFQHGANGIESSFSFAKRLLPVSAAYALLAGIGLYLIAPAIPYLLGSDYQNAVGAIRWLALLPFLKGIQYFLADALTGADYQGLRTIIQLLVAVFNVLINLWLIPAYSWLGAAWATIASDTILVLGLWGALYHLRRKKRDWLG